MSVVALALLAAAAGATLEGARESNGALAALVVAIAAAALALLLGLGPMIAVLISLAVVASARLWPRLSARRVAEQRARQLPALADQLAGALGAGMSLPGALAATASDTPAPLGDAVRTAALEIEAGQRLDVALSRLRAKVHEPSLDLIVSAIAIQRVVGGDLARSLRELSVRLEERERLAREVWGATAQARMTGVLVAALPAVAAVGVEIARPGLLLGLLTGPALVLAVVSLALQGVGLLLVHRLARVAL